MSKINSKECIREKFPDLFDTVLLVDGSALLYFNNKQISTSPFKISSVQNIKEIGNLYHKEISIINDDGRLFRIKLRFVIDDSFHKETITKYSGILYMYDDYELSDSVCAWLYDMDIDICYFSCEINTNIYYNRDVIMRRWTINNIIQ